MLSLGTNRGDRFVEKLVTFISLHHKVLWGHMPVKAQCYCYWVKQKHLDLNSRIFLTHRLAFVFAPYRPWVMPLLLLNYWSFRWGCKSYQGASLPSSLWALPFVVGLILVRGQSFYAIAPIKLVVQLMQTVARSRSLESYEFETE